MPGVSADKITRHRTVSANGFLDMLPGGAILDGTKVRDIDNPEVGESTRLRSGLMLGRATSGGKYSNSVFGQLQGAAAASATSLTLSAVQAIELVRRQGATGTFKLTGPPTASGVVATQTVTYSAVNTTSGVVTCSALSAAAVIGSFAQPNDGSEFMVSFIPDGWEMIVPAPDDLPMPHLPVAGLIDGTKLLPYPADPSLRAWVKAQMRSPVGPGVFSFTDSY